MATIDISTPEALGVALTEATLDPAVYALAHRIAVHTGLLREDQCTSDLYEYDPALLAGIYALAEDYAAVVRDADNGGEPGS